MDNPNWGRTLASPHVPATTRHPVRLCARRRRVRRRRRRRHGDRRDTCSRRRRDAEEPAADDGGEEPEEPAADDGGEDPEEPAADDGGEEPGGGGEAPERESGTASGEPIKIGFQNPEGDPAGSFPEYSIAAQAAADYINAELNGLGGRPIELDVCVMAITPDDSQRCANELSSDGVELAVSSLNFFGNHFAIYQGSNIPVVVGTPITVGDFTSEGVFSVGGGGGCLGVHTGMVFAATQLIPRVHRRAGHQGQRPVGRHAPGRRLLLRPRGQAPRRPQRQRPRRLRTRRLHARPRTHRCADPARLRRRHRPGHRGVRLRARRHHLLGPGRRLLDLRRRPDPPRLDPRGDTAGALRCLHRLHRHGTGR
jgi:hypothetical protein